MSATAVSTRARRSGYAVALGLTLSRLALALPLAIVGASRGSGLLAALLLVAGFLSDVFDGIVARRYGVATAGLRRLDSAVDSVFYLAAAFCAWRLHPEAIMNRRWWIATVIGTLILNHAIEYWKFRREASYHAWSAKLWGVALFTALTVLFAWGRAELLTVALLLGVVSHLENFLITLVLPHWEHDVKSVFFALAIRRRSSGA